MFKRLWDKIGVNELDLVVFECFEFRKKVIKIVYMFGFSLDV